MIVIYQKVNKENYWEINKCKDTIPDCKECDTQTTPPCKGRKFPSKNDCYNSGECNRNYTHLRLGGPYEGCQQQICNSSKDCMCKNKSKILDCCKKSCPQSPKEAKDMCIESCVPMIDPCQ